MIPTLEEDWRHTAHTKFSESSLKIRIMQKPYFFFAEKI